MPGWLESLGGPFVVVPTDRLSHWTGSNDDEPDSDYAAACAVHAYLGVIARPAADVLVLGDEPMPTRSIVIDGVHGFARWQWAETDDVAARVLGGLRLSSLPPAEEKLQWTVSGGVSLLDAVYAGTAAPARIDVPLAPGTYLVTAHRIEPDDQTCFIVVLLRRL